MQTRYYRSKIGRLPFAVRNELNERMRDGATGTSLLEWVNQHPEFQKVRKETGCEVLNAQNLTDWRGTGYKDWLDEQQKTERLRGLASLSEQIAVQTGGDPASVGCRIIAGRLLDVLETAPETAAAALSKAFVDLRNAETKAASADIKRQQVQLSEQALALERDKFRRQTCELFLKWYNDQNALSIASGSGSQSEKIQALLAFMDKEQQA